MNKETLVFKPNDIKVTLGDKDYRLVYDLNAFCELEKIYDSVDAILHMLLGSDNVEMPQVTYQGTVIPPAEVMLAGVPLDVYIAQNITPVKKAKHEDTLNLLWAGLLHDHAIWNGDGELEGYSITKARVGSYVTLRNIREINAQIVLALLQDLLPPTEGLEGEEGKNEQAPEQKILTLASKDEA